MCGRQLAGSRWVKGSNRLRHSGRAVAEALKELLGCEAQLSWVCFRCYRLVLGLDYHTHQLEKQRLTLLRLYDSMEKTEQQANGALGEKTSYSVGESGISGVDTNSRCHVAKEILNTLNISKDQSASNGYADSVGQKLDKGLGYDTTCKADNKVLSYPLQCVYDHEYYRNNDQDSLPGKPATDLEGYGLSSTEILLDQHCTEKLVSGTLIPSVKESIIKDKQKLGNDNTVPKNNKCFTDNSLKQDHENHFGKQEETAAASAVPLSQRLAAKRRKTAKKWDDFEYYEDESKTTELECDKIDNLPQAHQFQLPPRTGRKRCQKCKEEFATKKAILNHGCGQVKRREREKVKYTCKGCLHIFLLRRDYIKHANACYKNTPVTCNLCLVSVTIIIMITFDASLLEEMTMEKMFS